MSKRTVIILTAAGVLAAGGTAIAASAGDDDATDTPITGEALERAKAAALAVEPGEVTATEVGDEESRYEVEVTRPDGSQVDVQLDRHLDVVTSETDSEKED